MMPVSLDACLTVVDGRLRVEGCDAHALAERHGTPLNVMSEDQLRRNVRRIAAAFAAAWPHGPVRLLPAIKANPTLALRRVLDEEGAGCDAFGAPEVEAALRAGTPPERISFNGPTKDDAALARAVTLGVRVTADSLDELERLDAVARGLGRRAAVRLRLRPHVPELTMLSDLVEAPFSVADAVLAYKPGIPGDQVAAAGALLARAEGLDARGVHMHLPRHAADPQAWAVAMRAYAALIAELAAAAGGWRPREIDVGGGFPSARDPAGRALARRSGAPPPPPIEAFADAVGSALAAALQAAGIAIDGVVLEAEPGRSLYGDAGVHLTRVLSVKRQSAPALYTWIETDTSEAFLPDGLLEHNRWTVLAAGRMDDPPALRGDVVGRSCGFDVLASAVELPELAAGDLLAILDTGAYQDAASSNFNAMPRPATVLVSGDRDALVKRRETLADVFARDVAPGGAGRLDHTGVTVSDLDRSLGFYRDLLGLPVRATGEDDGPHVAAITGLDGARIRFADLDAGGGRLVELLQYLSPTAAAAPAAPNVPGSGHVAIQVADVASAVARLREAGVTIRSSGPVAIDDDGDWAGVTCLYATDPDGFTVELVERAGG
jgi:diaminopimelate decarboxylase